MGFVFILSNNYVTVQFYFILADESSLTNKMAVWSDIKNFRVQDAVVAVLLRKIYGWYELFYWFTGFSSRNSQHKYIRLNSRW